MSEKPQENPSTSQLDADLAALKKSVGEPQLASHAGSSRGGKAAADFASASLVGMGLGFGFDYFVGSLPWGMIVGLMVGVVAGFRMLMRATSSGDAPSDTGEK